MKRALKKSERIYRTVAKARYEHETSDPAEFAACIAECRAQGLKYRIVKGEFLKQVKP